MGRKGAYAMLDFETGTVPQTAAPENTSAVPSFADEAQNYTTPAPQPDLSAAEADPPFPGTVLRPGSFGSEVARIQTYLNALRDVEYPTLPHLSVDGRFGSGTSSAVMRYQALNGLSMDGQVGPNTWNAIVGNYNTAVGGSADTFPGITLRPGMRGEDVRHMQRSLNELGRLYTAINEQNADGIYGEQMTEAVRRFQRQFSLSADGILGRLTWQRIVDVRHAMTAGAPVPVTTPYPGTALRVGARGDDVRFVQSYLNALSVGAPMLTVDGIYGRGTALAVAVYQASAGLQADGVVGAATWNALIPAFNASL